MGMRRILSLGLAAALCASAAVQPVRARKGMVVTREPHATEVGLAVLKSGGNAIDAAVAVGFALSVTLPSAGNIGGGGFLLARFADGRTTFIDFRERAPGKATRDMYLDAAGNLTDASTLGHKAAGVPGTVRGLELASRKYGRKPWGELVAPAIELAGKGFPVSYGFAESLRNSTLLARFPESHRIFQRDGKFYEPGERLIQTDLARTLERIRRHGADGFYKGETARLLAADMQASGGLITLSDLEEYRAVERAPIAGSYRGYSVITAPPPSSGGIGVLQMLGVLEETDFAKHGAGSAASLHMLAETMRRYFADRSEYLADPDFYQVPVSRLLDKRYIAGLRRSIDSSRATPSVELRPGALFVPESADTTHYTVADAEGNVVAVTYTINETYGSGATAKGLGFLLNNEMDDFSAKPGHPNMFKLIQGEANAIQPRKRPLSAMTPTILLRDGRFYMATGSPGGGTIINTVLQTIVNVVDFGMNIQEAVNWPRIHHQWMPDELRMERGFSPDTIELLRGRGHQIRIVESQGNSAAILFDGSWLQGAADPRAEGTAKGY
jgi:gamma-glutamyltranspeptidase / glutathione hydrolase